MFSIDSEFKSDNKWFLLIVFNRYRHEKKIVESWLQTDKLSQSLSIPMSHSLLICIEAKKKKQRRFGDKQHFHLSGFNYYLLEIHIVDQTKHDEWVFSKVKDAWSGCDSKSTIQCWSKKWSHWHKWIGWFFIQLFVPEHGTLKQWVGIWIEVTNTLKQTCVYLLLENLILWCD